MSRNPKPIKTGSSRTTNFLLAFQAKSSIEMQRVEAGDVGFPTRRRLHPASRFSSDFQLDQPPVFDRATGESIPWAWLKTIRRSLVRHHRHSETKFLGGDGNERGILRRRHVKAFAFQAIGKEADNLEERETLGETDDPIEYEVAGISRKAILSEINDLRSTFGISDTEVWTTARVSHHTLADLKRGVRIDPQSMLNIRTAVISLRHGVEAQFHHDNVLLEQLSAQAETVGGIAALARTLGVTRQYLGRVLRKEKPMTESIRRFATSRPCGMDTT